MQVVDANGNVFGQGLEITGIDGKPKVPVINTDITIGTTAIIGGVDGRILFQGTGGVVQESGNLAWDITNSRITINTTTGGPAAIFKNATNGLTITPTSTKVSVYSDYFGAGTDKMLILGTYANQTNQLSLFTTGNIGVNTATDSGYKFDINGSARVSTALWTDVISPVSSSLYIYSVGLSGGGYNRLNIYYNSVNGFVMQSDGGAGGSRSMSIFGGGPGGVLNLGTNGTTRWTFTSSYDALGPGHIIPAITNTYDIGSTTNTARAIYSNIGRFSGAVTAATNLAQGVSISNTLTASANNDVLIGLDVLPTFTNGAFTGVTNYAARFGGDVYFGYGNRTLGIQPPSSSANGGAITILGGNATTSGTGGSVNIYGGIGAGGGGRGAINIGQVGYSTVNLGGYIYINNSGPNTGTVVQISAGGQNGLNIYWDNLTPFMQYGLVSGRQARFVNSSSYSFSTNLIIGATVNAGYMLDVNGTARVQNAFTIASSVFNVLSTSSSLFFVDTGSNNYRIANFIGYGGYHPGSGTNNTGDIFSVGANPSSSANGTSFFRLNYNGGNSSGIYGSSGNNVSLAQLNATTLSKLYLTAQGSGLLLQGGTSGNSIISTVADGDNLNLRSEKGTGGGGGGINYLSSINGSNHSHRFFHNNVEQMRLQYSGNLLIGTTTDSGYKLNVNGGGYFEGNLKVNGTITASIPTPNAYVCNIGLAADQSIASGSDAQIDFVDIDDTNNWYDPTTKRFTPTVAGYYHVDFGVWFDAATVSTGQYNVQIRKNASTVLIVQQPNINNGTGQSLTGSKLIYFNGTTDYIDFTAYQSTGVNRNLQTGASSSGTYASIFLLAV